MRRLAAAAAGLGVLATLLAGCGSSRSSAPDLSRAALPGKTVAHRFPEAGVKLRAPKGWPVKEGSAPLVATISSGRASVAIWRYPRQELLPADKAALQAARKRLVKAVKKAEGDAHVAGSRLVKVGGAHGIQLRGREVIRGQARALRSTHLFSHGAEVVVDELAPPDGFPRVDRHVFRPLLRSLHLGAPKEAKPEKQPKSQEQPKQPEKP